jgi:hypothetical protein
MVGVSTEISTDKYNLVKFEFDEKFSSSDFLKFLGILSSLLDIADRTGKPFGFYIDAHRPNKIVDVASVGQSLISWKQKESNRIRNNKKLICSAVYMKNETLVSFIGSVLKRSPTVTPNLITSNLDTAKQFVIGHLNKI